MIKYMMLHESRLNFKEEAEMIGAEYDVFNKPEYGSIPMFKMEDNQHGGLPFFIKKHSVSNFHGLLHRHEYMQINYVFRGKGRHYLNKNMFEIVKGDIFVIPPYIPHQICGIEQEELMICEFEFVPEYVSRYFEMHDSAESFLDFAYIEPFLVSESKMKPRLNLTGESQLEVENILTEAISEYESRSPGFVLIVKALLLKLLVIVGREFSRSLEKADVHNEFSRHRESINGAMGYISENYMKDLNAEEVSKKFMLSLSYFRYLFKSISSKTFTEYLNEVRVIKAMELLKTTDKRVIDVSFETGFNNVNHFNKVFRHYTGLTPLGYRKSTR